MTRMELRRVIRTVYVAVFAFVLLAGMAGYEAVRPAASTPVELDEGRGGLLGGDGS